jgi:hypothetical protein
MLKVFGGIGAVLFALQSVSSFAQPDGDQPDPRLWNRPCTNPVVNPGPSAWKTSAEAPSPVSATHQALVETFTWGALKNDRAALESVTDGEWLASKEAESCIAAVRAISTACKSEPLYRLFDGQIRLAWICNEQTPYRVYFLIRDDQIANVRSLDTSGPLFVQLPLPPG